MLAFFFWERHLLAAILPHGASRTKETKTVWGFIWAFGQTDGCLGLVNFLFQPRGYRKWFVSFKYGVAHRNVNVNTSPHITF